MAINERGVFTCNCTGMIGLFGGWIVYGVVCDLYLREGLDDFRAVIIYWAWKMADATDVVYVGSFERRGQQLSQQK